MLYQAPRCGAPYTSTLDGNGNLTCFFSSVPDVIWAAIIASVLTFAGVLLTNRHYARQQKAQLEHERKLAEADRMFKLREGVYLAAAAEVTAAYQQLTNLSSIDVSKVNPADGLAGFFVAANQASLVASDDTVKTISEFMIGYSGAFFELLGKVGPIQEARVDRDIYDGNHQQYRNEVSRILSSMTQFNEEAKANSAVWNALERSLEFNMKEAEKAASARDDAWQELNAQKLVFLREAVPAVKAVANLAIPALVAIRNELGISTDIDAYRDDFENRFTRVQQQLEQFVSKITSGAV